MNPGLIFRHVRWALIGLLLMLAAGAAAVHFSTGFHDQANAAQRAALAARADAQGKLSRAREEEQELRASAARHDALQRQGILGEERRLDWVERMRALRDTHRIYDLRYEIAPQKALSTPAGGRFQFMVSTMRLNLLLLHEEDLLRVLHDLGEDVSAHVRTRHCSVERLPSSAQPSTTVAPQLKAECELDWITVRDTQPNGAKS
ncbi:MAG: hypothetical protein E6R11_05325 [Rhodocyclaceae bacterium]|jgi:hypothetical protein|nr:MAG: hypothetical protein E6R11_05325 [Rhodocyclaceae bacterium]